MPYSAVAFPSGQQANARQPTPADELTPASQRPLMMRPTPADDEARGEAMLASSGCGSGGRVTRLAAATGAEWFPRPPWRLPYSAVGFPRGGWSGIQPWFCTSVGRPACGQGYSPGFAPLLAGMRSGMQPWICTSVGVGVRSEKRRHGSRKHHTTNAKHV